MTKVNIGKQLLELIEKNYDPSLFPVQKGNKINIGSYSILPTDAGYKVKCYKTNSIIAVTYTKHAALAIAKSLTKKNNAVKRIMELDAIIAKHHVDCIFYKNTIKKTKSMTMLESTLFRYDISKQKTNEAKEQLNKFIL